MLDVAIGTGRRERLIGLMNGAIVATQTSLIGRALLKAGLRHMAGSALLPEQRVGVCKRPGVIRFRTPRHGMPAEPCQAHDHKYARQNPPPAWNAMQRLEVFQID